VSADGRLLYVSQFLRQPGVTVIDTRTFSARNVVALAEEPPSPDRGKKAPNGLARGVYAAVPRPHGGDVWLPHLLLAVKTPEPDLDFQSTVFPTISTVSADGTSANRILFQPLDAPGTNASFSDVVSGPRAIAFTPDGKLALVAMSQSEDVMVFDGDTGYEVGLVRPLPGAFLEGIAIDRWGAHAYVDGRNTHNVTVLALDPTNTFAPATVDGDPIDRIAADPMPPELRFGQRLFYTANSAAFPVTRNFWVACSTCHLEGATDAVTWLFTVGPRDTPSNAGGPINTGFLLRQALRNSVVDYDTTINLEQGGNYHRGLAGQKEQLDALAAFVNFAIPFPQNPNLAPDGTLTESQARGAATFKSRCAACHKGDYLTDSAEGNASLDLAGPVVLHDIGTCVKDGFLDQPAPDEVIGRMHTACDFDTPTLRGVFATAPYYHDGSAQTLEEAVDRLPFVGDLSPAAKADLVAYLKTL
jgi:mono/diheme cytochrome c family protein